jgi:hypothetical protein
MVSMSSRKLQVFHEYRYGPRSVLVPGDRFRISGGPVYVTDDGKPIAVADRGVFVFRCYCIQGAAKLLEAYRGDGGGLAILWVGRTSRSRAIPNLRRKPYRVTGKVHDAKATPRKR